MKTSSHQPHSQGSYFAPIQGFELVGGSYLLLVLERPPTFEYQAGQYVTFFLEDSGGPFQRSYSIAGAPSDRKRLEFCIQISNDGRAAALFKSLPQHAPVSLSEPAGKFRIPDTQRPLVFLAGGSGISPLRSFIHEQLESGSDSNSRMLLIYGCRKACAFPFRESLLEQAHRHQNRFSLRLMAEKGTAAGVAIGNVITALSEVLEGISSETHFVLCGPRPMIQNVKQVLSESGFGPTQVFSEDW